MNFRIASPCHAGWDRMSGDGRVRFCDSCQLNVYNFSEMTSDEINSLILKTEGRLCARLYRRTDGTIITRDCPVGIKAFRQKISRVATAAFATILSACSFVFSQTPKQDKECKQIPAITFERKQTVDHQAATFAGRVLDRASAVVPGVAVTILDSNGNKIRKTTTNENGDFSLVGIPEGNYSLKVAAVGFKNLAVNKLELHSTEVTTVQVVLEFARMTMNMGILDFQ
jgi:hypothetical protein